jgi:HEAT repeat protein
MRSVTRAVVVLLAVAALPSLVGAQIPLDAGRKRLQERYQKPASQQKLDDVVKKLNGDDPEARIEAVRTLGEMNEPKATEYLLQAANDPDTRIRIKAIDTLGNAHAKEATPFLVQQLFLRTTDLPSKQRILAALGKIGDKRATGPLLDIMARDGDMAVRGNAIFALGEIGDGDALPGLERVANDGQEDVLRRLAAESVRKIRERPVPTVVPPALSDRRRPEGPATP